MAVFPSHGVPANPEHLPDHAGAVRNGTDPGSTVVSPSDRHLDHRETGAVGKKQNLRVKAPALDFLQGKQRSCGISTECLKAALGVFEIQPENYSQQKIENASNVTQSPRRRRTLSLPEV
jgi:hypothetical protein